MHKSRFPRALSHDEFLAAVLDEPIRLDTASFVAAILGEQNFDPNQPRDERGRWTSGGSSGRSAVTGRDSVPENPGDVSSDASSSYRTGDTSATSADRSTGATGATGDKSPTGMGAASVPLGKGVHSYFSGDYQAAMDYLDRAAKADPDDPRTYYFRGLAKYQLGQTDAAKRDFDLGAAAERADSDKRYNVGQFIYRVQGGLRAVLETFRKNGRRSAAKLAVMSNLEDSTYFKSLKEKDATTAASLETRFYNVISRMSEQSLLYLQMGLKNVACFRDDVAIRAALKGYPYLLSYYETNHPLAFYDPVRSWLWVRARDFGGAGEGWHTLPHELAHAIDAAGRFSRQADWDAAWTSELKGVPVNDEEFKRLFRARFGDVPVEKIDGKDYLIWSRGARTASYPIGAYATTSAGEGFAEFFYRLLVADQVGLQYLRQRFPKCWEFFQKYGLLPYY